MPTLTTANLSHPPVIPSSSIPAPLVSYLQCALLVAISRTCSCWFPLPGNFSLSSLTWATGLSCDINSSETIFPSLSVNSHPHLTTLHRTDPFLKFSVSGNSFSTCAQTASTVCTYSVQFSHSVVSNTLRPCGQQLTSLLRPSANPGAYSNSCPSHQ